MAFHGLWGRSNTPSESGAILARREPVLTGTDRPHPRPTKGKHAWTAWQN